MRGSKPDRRPDLTAAGGVESHTNLPNFYPNLQIDNKS